MQNRVSISVKSLENLLSYLINRPYKEVVVLIKEIKDDVKEIKSEEVEQETKP